VDVLTYGRGSNNDADLRGLRVLLTGAGGALGKAVAELLTAKAATVVLVDRDTTALETLAGQLRARGAIVDVHTADLLDDSALAELVHTVEGAGPIDALVTCHGIEVNARFDRLSTAQLDTQIDIHLRSPMMLIHHVLPGMLRRGRGHVVIVSSLNGKLPFPGKVPYAAAKAGSIAMVHALRRDFDDTPVRFSVVLPGIVSGEGQAARAMSTANVQAPRLVGTVSPAQCARGILRALVEGCPEVTVTARSTTLAAGLQWTHPRLADKLLERTGIMGFWRTIARAGNSGSAS
jgi:short-subunit dehydrogenase